LSLFSVFLLGSGSYKVKGLTFRISADLRLNGLNGATVIAFPPFGELRATTHKTPLNLRIELKKISTPELKNMAAQVIKRGNKKVIKSFEESIVETAKRWLLRIIIIGSLCPFVVLLVVFRSNLRQSLSALAIGLITISTFSFATFTSFDPSGFNQPTYSGMLSMAPWLINTVQGKMKEFSLFRSKFNEMLNNAGKISKKIDAWQSGSLDDKTIKILQVSDVHNNPVAFDLMKNSIVDFKVDAIIDLGDITDYGTNLESPFIQKIGELKLPYIFVTGNHDSEEVTKELGSLKNVIILKNSGYKFKGINLYGINDPGATLSTIAPLNSNQSKDFSGKLKIDLTNRKISADVLLIHNPDYAKSVFGLFKYILTGHTHKPSIIQKKDTIEINAGTAGGAGIRTFEHEDGVPYSFKILYFKTDPVRITAIDSVSFSGIDEEFTLQRSTFPQKTGNDLALKNSITQVNGKFLKSRIP
jgi:predicted phosphodiesterase